MPESTDMCETELKDCQTLFLLKSMRRTGAETPQHYWNGSLTALESSPCSTMLLPGALLVSWNGYFLPARWPLIVLMSFDGEL